MTTRILQMIFQIISYLVDYLSGSLHLSAGVPFKLFLLHLHHWVLSTNYYFSYITSVFIYDL
jgi:hypothetical protein